MKKLLLILLLLSSAVYGQQNNTTNTNFTNGLGASKFFNIPRGTTLPTTGILAGSLFYHTTLGLRYYDGSSWQTVGVSGSGVTSFNSRTGAIVPISGDYDAFYPLLSGSYADPSWITSLAWSKITGAPTAFPTPFSLTAGYGLTGDFFNGNIARTWVVDTTSATGLVSKSRLDATNFGISRVTGLQDSLSNKYSKSDANNRFTRGKLVTKVYCLGNSLTADGRYEIQLQNLLGSDYQVINKGISGNITEQMIYRFPYDILSQGGSDYSFNQGGIPHPDMSYMILLGGVNDINHAGSTALQIIANLQTMYTTASNAGAKVVAVTILPYKGNGVWSSARQVVVDSVNAWLLSSSPVDVDYKINAYPVLEDPSNPGYLLPEYSDDGLHLSTAGYQALGDAIYTGTTWTKSVTQYSLSLSNDVSLNQNLRTSDVAQFKSVEVEASGDINNLTPSGFILKNGQNTPQWGIRNNTYFSSPTALKNQFGIYSYTTGKDGITIFDDGLIQFGNSFQPDVDDAYDLGQNGRRFRDLQVSRDLISGRHLSVYGNTTFYGTAALSYSGGTNGFSLTNTATGRGLQITNTGAGFGSLIDNSSSGTGVQISNTGTGKGVYILNDSTGTGQWIERASNSDGLVINAGVGTTGNSLTITRDTTLKLNIDGDGNLSTSGDISAASFVGNLTGNASTVTNGVYSTTFNGLGDARYLQLSGNQTISGYIRNTGGLGNMFGFKHESNPEITLYQNVTHWAFYNAVSGRDVIKFNNTTDIATFAVSPEMPTLSAGDNSTKGATTAYADAKVQNNLTASTTIAPSATAVNTALDLKADLASPALTGTPTAPTAAPGTNTTQIATMAALQAAIPTVVNVVEQDNFNAVSSDAVYSAIRPYKVYTAVISQSGTAAPTVDYTLENSIGAIVWSRTAAGVYKATLTGAFTSSKVWISITNGVFSGATSAAKAVSVYRNSANEIEVDTYDSSASADDVLSLANIEIRVYN